MPKQITIDPAHRPSRLRKSKGFRLYFRFLYCHWQRGLPILTKKHFHSFCEIHIVMLSDKAESITALLGSVIVPSVSFDGDAVIALQTHLSAGAHQLLTTTAQQFLQVDLVGALDLVFSIFAVIYDASQMNPPSVLVSLCLTFRFDTQGSFLFLDLPPDLSLHDLLGIGRILVLLLSEQIPQMVQQTTDAL